MRTIETPAQGEVSTCAKKGGVSGTDRRQTRLFGEDNRTPTYVAFDVETPNRANDRMSAIGVTLITGDAVTGGFYSLVDPETRFDFFNARLTGINEKTVRGAPTFPEIWKRIEPMMNSGILVAHNAAFDMGVLKRCLDSYHIRWKPSAEYLCTVRIGRRLLPGISHKLNAMCDYYGIELNHHHAESDSRACAQILLKYMERGVNIESFIKTYIL